MYLNLHSFNARSSHDTLYRVIVTFESEEWAMKTLDVIKEYNNGKDVVYTCAKCEVPSCESPRYLDMMWEFGYRTREEAETIDTKIKELVGECTTDRPIEIDSASCPFLS